MDLKFLDEIESIIQQLSVGKISPNKKADTEV